MKNELILVESKAARDEYVELVDILDKVKKLSLLPDNTNVSAQMVADYYEVGKNTIDPLISRHKDELVEDGLQVLKGNELKEFVTCMMQATNNKFQVSNKARSMVILPRRAVLRIGMLLRDSEVAKQVRTYLLDQEQTIRTEKKETVPTDTKPSEPLQLSETELQVKRMELLESQLQRLDRLQNEYKLSEEVHMQAISKVYGMVGVEISFSQTENGNRWYSCLDIARYVDIYSTNDKPHVQFVAALIKHYYHTFRETDVYQDVATKGNWMGITEKYSERVAKSILKWMEANNRPSVVYIGGKSYQLEYKKHKSSLRAITVEPIAS